MSSHTAKKQKTVAGNVSSSVKGVGNAAVKQTEKAIHDIQGAVQSIAFALGVAPTKKRKVGPKRPKAAGDGQHGGKKTRKAKTRKMRKRMTRRRR